MADRPPQRAPEGAPLPPIDDPAFEWRVAFATELFSRPDVDSPIRTHLEAGAPLALLDEHGAFCQVRTADGRIGYVGKLAVVHDRTRSRRAPTHSGPAVEPPPLPWELERRREATAPDGEPVAAAAAEPPPLPWEREHAGPTAVGEQLPAAAELAPAEPEPSPPPDAAELPTAVESPPAAPPAEEPERRRGPLGWLRARLARRAAAPADAASTAAAPGRRRQLGRRALRLVAMLLMLVGLFEVLGWALGLLSPPRPTAAEPTASPVIAAVRGPDGQVDVSLDTRTIAGVAGVSVVWVVLTAAALGSGAALPAAAMIVPALGLTTAANAAAGLMPPERVIVVDLGSAAQASRSGPPIALRRVSGERVAITLRSDVAERLPGVPPPARPRVGAGAAAGSAGAPVASAAVGVPRPAGALDLGFILDASGSMLERIDGRPKIDIAKEALNAFLASVDPTVHVGLWVYGHRRGDRTFQCQQIELLQPIGPVDAAALRAQIDEIVPFGWTPLAASLEYAARDFRRLPGITEILVLISDGEETCGGDPIRAAADAKRAHPGLTIHTVGLAVTPETRRQLELIASVGGGSYYDARDARALAEALAAIRRVEE